MALTLKSLAVPYKAWDGAVIFWMLPFTSFAVDARVETFSHLHPRFRYRNPQTGEWRLTEPPEYTAALDLAQGMTPEELDEFKPFEDVSWVKESVWSAAADCFALCEPLTVDIEQAGGDAALPAAAKALLLYWQEHGASLDEDWANFQRLLGGEAVNEWLLAYQTTRDHRMDAPEAPEGHAAPQSSSGGKHTRKRSSRNSATSQPTSAGSAPRKA